MLSTSLTAVPPQPVKSMQNRDVEKAIWRQKPSGPRPRIHQDSYGQPLPPLSGHEGKNHWWPRPISSGPPIPMLLSPPAPRPASLIFLRALHKLLTAEENSEPSVPAYFPHLFYPTTVIFGFLFKFLLFTLQGVKNGGGGQ